MEIGEIIISTVPDHVPIHGADDMHAVADSFQNAAWVGIGPRREYFHPVVTLYFSGPDAAAKAGRLAAAINAAMAEQAPAIKQAAE